MKKTSISYKTSNLLIENLKKQENIEVLKKENFISSLFGKKKYADVYFHSGNLDEKSIENIKNSKITIVNSFASMNYIIAKTKISYEKIKVIYPSINVEYKKPKEVKIKLCEELNIDPKTKLILFTAKNFKTSGVKEFLDICSSITYSDFKIIIAGEQKQISALQFQLPKYQNLQDKIILLENYKNIDELFLASDIFLLPTYNKTFSSNILKAMYCKCVVFLSIDNDAKEVVDVFASMDSPTDPSIAFKIDAVLLDKNELKKIKKENKKLAKEFELEANLNKMNFILENI
ncbi:MAG: glycosyltransferase [Arcobacter sp.]|jgi:glycosyltransferase involved in cell wall biosynthesis|uniref:glycosyltransferase n=1 Tax=Arcobacter sp. TaxID=1872629 RepID=UPI002A759CDA|nr:glycosyltransferase [Arcobacter sp.]MDY3204423.1 glycosyltransferase [Arcobacter sp.]